MPQRQDDFSLITVRFLGDQVNHRCSNPKCGAPTMGPGDPGKISNLGVAAHIKAASRGGPRYDENQTSEERRHPVNGIHLCQSCGKLVDDVLSFHTVEQLQNWKDDAIRLARRALSTRDIDPDGRTRLRRETNDQTAKSLLRKLFNARRLAFQGIRIAESLRNANPHMNQWAQIEASFKSWAKSANESHAELSDLLLDIRVVWGQAAVAEEVVHMTVYLNRWRSICIYRHWDLIGIDYGTESEPDAEDGETWSWGLVFDGDEKHRKMLTGAIDRIVERAESSVKAFISSRGPE